MDSRPAFEPKDIPAFTVTLAGVGLLAATILIAFLMWFLFAWLSRTHENVTPRAGLAPEFDRLQQPLLQSSPRMDMDALRKRDARILNGYTWVDRQKGIVSIPVDRAMEKVLRDGLPGQADYSDLKLYPPRSGSRETGFD